MTPCPLCRSAIPDSEDRCPSCGTRVKRDAPQTPPPAFAPVPTSPAPSFAAPPPTAPSFGSAPRSAPGFAAPPSAAPSLPYFFTPAGTAAAPGAGGAGAAPFFSPPPPSRGAMWSPPPTDISTTRKRGSLRGPLKLIGALLTIGLVITVARNVFMSVNESVKVSEYARGTASSPYTSDEGNFAASFPTHPVPSDRTLRGADGTAVVLHDVASHPGKHYAFEVAYLDFPNVSYPNGDAALQGFIDGMAGDAKGQVTRRTVATLDAMSAVEFVMKYKDNGQDATAICRVALRGNRLYLLAVTAPNEENGGFTRLADSFHLVGT